MVFTRPSTGKTRSLICIQDLVKAITLSDLPNTINLTRFLYQICPRDKSDENNYLYV